MKTIKITTLIILALSCSLHAQQGTGISESKIDNKTNLFNSSDSLQYSLGAFLGKWILTNNFSITRAELFLKGMDDALQQKALAIPDSIINQRIAGYQLISQNETRKQQEAKLFAELKTKQGIGILPSGVHYLVIKQGSGIRPLAKDSVVLHAMGMFPDGTVFEDTQKKNKPFTMAVENLIPGLSEAIQLMPEGSVWRVFVPSALGYGAAGLQGVIPPNSALVYDIAVLQVKQFVIPKSK
ncbi:MAG: FKBP-type peptidyl-prolyl cis-trans isomerase [Bacteroidales bacterium]